MAQRSLSALARANVPKVMSCQRRHHFVPKAAARHSKHLVEFARSDSDMLNVRALSGSGPGTRARLGVGVDQDHFLTGGGGGHGDVDSERSFAAPALLTHEGNGFHGLTPFLLLLGSAYADPASFRSRSIKSASSRSRAAKSDATVCLADKTSFASFAAWVIESSLR